MPQPSELPPDDQADGEVIILPEVGKKSKALGRHAKYFLQKDADEAIRDPQDLEQLGLATQRLNAGDVDLKDLEIDLGKLDLKLKEDDDPSD